MKRYEPCYNGNGDPAMAESPNGKYYSRADLIAAGVLVPVPDGEACELVTLYGHQKFLLDSYGVCEMKNPGQYDIKVDVRVLATGEIITSEKYAVFVRPVFLVPLEDVG